jgi:hypothetical protein
MLVSLVFRSFSFFVFTQAASAWFAVSPAQGVFRRSITPRVLKYFLGRKKPCSVGKSGEDYRSPRRFAITGTVGKAARFWSAPSFKCPNLRQTMIALHNRAFRNRSVSEKMQREHDFLKIACALSIA